jgi:trigger factor
VKVTAQEIEERQMVLEVEVEDERLERAMDEAYKRISTRINVPGFRRGRAPRPLVERMVGREAILEDAVEKLVPQVYRDALQEQQISAAGQPNVEVTSTEPLHFKATVPLTPSVELGDYRSVEVPLEEIVVTAEEIDSVVQRLRESQATWAPVERAVQIGDRVGLDVKGVRDGRSIMDTNDAEFVVDPDGPEPMSGFSQQLVGLEAGQERSFTLGEPPAEATDEQPARSDTRTEFAVKVHGVKERQLPELDDEFVKSVGEYETVEKLREEIETSIRRRKEFEARSKQRDQIVEAAVEQATVVAPPQMVEQQAQSLLESMASTLDRQGITIQQYLQITGKSESDFRAELLEDARKTLKRNLVLEAIGGAEQLEVGDDEIRAEIEAAFQGGRDGARRAREAYRRPETRTRIASLLKVRKAGQWLVEHAGGQPDEPSEEAEEQSLEQSGEQAEQPQASTDDPTTGEQPAEEQPTDKQPATDQRGQAQASGVTRDV